MDKVRREKGDGEKGRNKEGAWEKTKGMEVKRRKRRDLLLESKGRRREVRK